MADKNIQKITILQKDLPEIKSTSKYIFRYRVKHKTDSTFSEWSELKEISLKHSISSLVAAEPIKYSLTQNGIFDSEKVSFSWTMPSSITINRFDVYLKWYDGLTEPTLQTRNSTNWVRYPSVVDGASLDLKIPTGSDWLEVAVNAASFPKFEGTSIDSESVFLFKTSLTKIPIRLDSGTITS